jgi:hypothetical protein
VSGDILPAIGDFPAGTRIASYQIEELIGRGGMAVVYRAVDVRLDRPVALKILAPELAADDAFRQRFIRESRSGAAVDHPNVIPVFEAGEADGVLFIAMRYVSGQDVRALIEREGRLSTARTVSIVTQVASALDSAHAHGLIHRDVKPANMLLAAAGDGASADHVYLSDFGLSKQSVSAASLTGTGQFLGTLDYMSPEQVEGRPIDGRTDLYALGCATFEMLTGEPPFRREQNLAVMWAQVSTPPPPIRQLRPELPPDVDKVIATALAKSPGDRQASCLEFAAALRAACGIRPGSQPDRPVAPSRPGNPPVAARPPGLDVTVTEQARDGSARPGSARPGNLAPTAGGGEPVGHQPTMGIQSVSAAPGYQGGGAAGYQPTTGYPGGSAAPGHPGAGAGSGYQGGGAGSGYQGGGAGSGYQGAGAAPGYRGGGGAPGQQAGGPNFGQPGSGQPRLTDQLLHDGTGRQPSGPGRQRGKGLPILIGCVIVLALVAVAIVVLHPKGLFSAKSGNSPTVAKTVTVSPSPTPNSTGSPGSPSTTPTQGTLPRAASPGAVITDYYNAINNHNYQAAWRINVQKHSEESFAEFKQGFADTQFDTLTVVSTSGDVVTIKLAAEQADGSPVKNFEGTYTVQDGTIVASYIAQVFS